MTYQLTSAETSKLLRKLMEERDLCLAEERQSCVFNASLGEDVESVRPEYDYKKTQALLNKLNAKIRTVKHAINCFNASQVVGETGLTIDQVLIRIPQLTEMRNRLYAMQNRLPKRRSSVAGIGSNTVIDYEYANYKIADAKADYLAVSDELRALQTALDLVNTTVQLEFELED